MNDNNLIQFYLKCQDVETGKTLTYRFANQDDLLAFSNHLSDNNLAIIDTHINFYDIDILFNPFGDVAIINNGDINTALDGNVQIIEWQQKTDS